MLAVAISPYIRRLKACFTALCNQFIDFDMTKLTRSQIILMIIIYRYTAGCQKIQTTISEAKLLKVTRLGRSTLYAAIKSLEKDGYLIVSQSSKGCCCRYSLRPDLQKLMTKAERAEKVQEFEAIKCSDLNFSQIEPNEVLELEAIVNKLKLQHGFASSPPVPEVLSFEEDSLAEQLEHFDVSPPMADKLAPEADPEVIQPVPEVFSFEEDSLAEQLEHFDVSPPMAEKLAREADPEVILQALAHVQEVQPHNLAGYLVAEIKRGGYSKNPSQEPHPLTEPLKQHGVNDFMARKLPRIAKAEVILKAIERLAKVQPINPAGYLVAEINRGGYRPSDKTKHIRLKHQKLQEVRQAQQLAEQAQADRQAAQGEAALEYFALLPPEHQASLRAQVDAQLPFRRLKPHWNDSHPAYRACLLEVLEIRSSPQDPYKDMFSMNVQHHCPSLIDESLAINKTLTDLGIEPQVAQNLARLCSPEVIAKAIERLHCNNPANPQAYLVAELQRGGYASDPKAKDQKLKQDRESLQRSRQIERNLEQELSERRAALDRALLEQFYQLPPEQQKPLLAEFERSAQRFARLRDWGPENPAYRGMLAEFLHPHLAEKEAS